MSEDEMRTLTRERLLKKLDAYLAGLTQYGAYGDVIRRKVREFRDQVMAHPWDDCSSFQGQLDDLFQHDMRGRRELKALELLRAKEEELDKHLLEDMGHSRRETLEPQDYTMLTDKSQDVLLVLQGKGSVIQLPRVMDSVRTIMIKDDCGGAFTVVPHEGESVNGSKEPMVCSGPYRCIRLTTAQLGKDESGENKYGWVVVD